MSEATHVTWPMLVVAVSLLLGLVGVVWHHLTRAHDQSQADHKSDIAEVFARMLDETKARHAVELSLVRDYARTDILRPMMEDVVAPLKTQLGHVERDVVALRQDLRDRQEARS